MDGGHNVYKFAARGNDRVKALMRYTEISPDLPAVSAISLGSWNTFSRVDFEDLVALLREALDLGINLFDVGYYWDKPHTEVVFGRALEVLGAPRSAYLITEKLWLWNYPEQSFADQLKGSLVRLNLDHVDLISVSRPTPELDFTAFVEEVTALIDAGLTRAWGITNFDAAQSRQAIAVAESKGRPAPALVQLQYNPCRRGVVETSEYDSLFAGTDLKLCAAFTLEGGILAGHLDRDRVNPSEMAMGKTPRERNIARDSGGVRPLVRERQSDLARIADEMGATAAQAAIAFSLSHPATATALVGVTRIEDLKENVRAIDLLDRTPDIRQRLASLEVANVTMPKLFNPHNDE